MKRTILCILLALLAVPCFAGTLDLKQSTARTVPVGPFMDPTDGSPETTLTVTSVDGTLFKATGTASDLGAITASAGSNDMVHQDDGMYSLELTATNVDTVGDLTLCLFIADALVFKETYCVLPANVYDAKYGADLLAVDAREISSSTTAADNAEVVFDTDFATNYDGTNDAWTARLSTGTGTGQISVTSGLLAWNPAWDAEVESEVADGLGVYDGPTNAEMDLRTIPTADYFDPAVDPVATVTTVGTTTNVTNAPTAGDFTATMKTSLETAAGNSLATYDPPTRTEATADKDEILAATYLLKTTVSGVSSQQTFQIATTSTPGVNDFKNCIVVFRDAGSNDFAVRQINNSEEQPGGTETEIILSTSVVEFTVATSDVVYIYPPSALAPDAIDSTKIAANSIGESELAANAITSSEVADGAIDAGAIAAGAITTASFAAGAIDAAAIAADAIGASELADGAIDAAALASDAIAAAKIAADVTTELLAPIMTDAHAEPTGAPAANETLAEKIGFLFATMRNKVTVTATEKTVYDDADAEQWDKELSDDGTTYTETEGAVAD